MANCVLRLAIYLLSASLVKLVTSSTSGSLNCPRRYILTVRSTSSGATEMCRSVTRSTSDDLSASELKPPQYLHLLT